MSLPLNKKIIIVDEEIKDILVGGEMPTVEDIVRDLTELATVERAKTPAQAPDNIGYNQILRSSMWNDMVDEMEIDIRAMRQTLDEAWEELKVSATQVLSVSPAFKRKAELLENIAIRALAITPFADSVSVRTQPIAVSGGVNFGSLDGVDIAKSQDIEANLEAGAIAIRKSASEVIRSSAEEAYNIGGEYQIQQDRKIGSPLWTNDGDLARMFSVNISSNSPSGEVWVEMSYRLSETDVSVKPLNRVEVVCPAGDNIKVDVWVSPDTPGNMTWYGSSSGSTRVIISGPTMHATTAKVRITKYKADDSHYHGSKLMHDYNFKIGEVIFMTASYALEASIVSDPISLNNAPIASAVVDMDADIPETSNVFLYMARDEATATSASDFRWIPVSQVSGEAEMSKLQEVMVFINAEHPAKVTEGAGSYSNDIWAIGIIEGKLKAIDEGIEQLRVQALTVDWATQTISSSGWDDVSYSGVINRTGDTLTGGNYFRLTTKIYSDITSSGVLPVLFDETEVVDENGNVITSVITDYLVVLNGIDITNRIKAGSDSVGFLAGENNLEVIIKASGIGNVEPYAQSTTFELRDIVGRKVMIDHPDVVSEMALVGTSGSAAQRISDKAVLLNHNVQNMQFRMYMENTEALPTSDIRLRAHMVKGTDGSTPQIRAIYVATGV